MTIATILLCKIAILRNDIMMINNPPRAKYFQFSPGLVGVRLTARHYLFTRIITVFVSHMIIHDTHFTIIINIETINFTTSDDDILSGRLSSRKISQN